MNADRVPTECPACGTELNLRAQHGWRYSVLSKALFAVAGISAFLSFFFVLDLVTYPDLPAEKITRVATGLAGMLLAFVAWRLPRIRNVHCHRCAWRARVSSSPGRSSP